MRFAKKMGRKKGKFDERIFMAGYRYENINNELKEIRWILGKAQAPFIPLKAK